VPCRCGAQVPPLHGARIVTAILSDPALRARWEDELRETRATLNTAHEALAKVRASHNGSSGRCSGRCIAVEVSGALLAWGAESG